MAEEVTANYRCTTAELYAIGDLIFANLASKLTPFSGYKGKYTEDFIEVGRAKREDAMEMPDEETRNAKFKTLRIDLKPLAKNCTKNYQSLKGYIEDAFEKDQHDTQFIAAGGNHYAAAANQSWESVVTLNTDMGKFITDNTTVLEGEDNDNMPTTFPTKVGTDKTLFNAKYLAMMAARQTGVQTAEKLKANNDLYAIITGIGSDSEKVFEDEEHLKLFRFSTLKNIVSPPGSASFKLMVLKNADDTPVTSGTVTIKAAGDPPMTATINEKGEAEFTDIDAAAYSVTVESDGFKKETFNKEVNTGTAARREVFMETAA